MGPIKARRALFALLCLAVAMPARAQDRDPGALRVALVLNIMRFVDFTPRAGNSPLILCVERSDPAGSGFMALNGQRVGGQAITVRPIADGAPADCDVLYLGQAAAPSIAKAQQPGLLLIGDGPDFIGNGGMIGLVQTGKQIRFEINARAARRAHLNISSQLLRLASRVQQ